MSNFKQGRFSKIDAHLLLVIGVLLVAGMLRFHDLDRTSLWLDESFSWYQASLPFREMYREAANSPHPPLQNFISWPWIRLFGDSEAAMRSLPATLGTLNVLLLYLTARLVWDRKTALIAAGLLAVSAFHIWYSQEFRDYALLALAATAYMHSVFRLLLHKSAVFLYNLAAGLTLLFSHVFGSFLFAGVTLYLSMAWLAGRRDLVFDHRKWLAAQVLVVAVYARWAVILLQNSETAGIHWIPELSVFQFFGQLSVLFNGPIAAPVLCSLALFGLFRAFFGPPPALDLPVVEGGGRWAWELLLIWAAFPVLVTVVLSVLVTPLLIDRYLILCLPAVCMLATAGLRPLRNHRALYVSTICLLAFGLSFELWRLAHRDREQYRMATRKVQACYRRGDLVVAMPHYSINAVRYYWRDPAIEILTLVDLLEPRLSVRNHERIWLIRRKVKLPRDISLADTVLGDRQASAWIDAQGVEAWLFSPATAGEPAIIDQCPGQLEPRQPPPKDAILH